MNVFYPKLSRDLLLQTMQEEERRLRKAGPNAPGFIRGDVLFGGFEIGVTRAAHNVVRWKRRIHEWHRRENTLAIRCFAHVFRKQYDINLSLVESLEEVFASVRHIARRLQDFYNEHRRLHAGAAERMARMENRILELEALVNRSKRPECEEVEFIPREPIADPDPDENGNSPHALPEEADYTIVRRKSRP
jgi:hypothetical protein